MSRILVCDDDPVQLNLRKMLLEAAGHTVGLAFNPGETLRHMSRQLPDVVVMDLRLLNRLGEPDAREGIELIRRIRERDARVPVIVLSGWPEEIYGQPEETMVSRVMVKPVQTRELLATIAELAPPPASGPSRNLPSASR